jgi:hypothetical protein
MGGFLDEATWRVNVEGDAVADGGEDRGDASETQVLRLRLSR